MSSTPKKRSRKQRADTPSTKPELPLILLGLTAFLVRVAAAIPLGKLPISRSPQYDALEYLLWAQQIAAGNFGWPHHPPHGPAYPFFLGAILAVGGGSLTFARVAQSIVGALTCCIAGVTAKRIFGARGSMITAALLALYAPLIWLDVSIAAEGLLMFLLAAALWSAVTQRSAILTGALAGIAALARPTALIVLPLLMWIGARTAKQRASMAIAAFALILPVTIANWRASHAFIPVQAFGGMNVYLGNSPLRDGMASARPGGDWEWIEAEAVRNGATSLAAEDSYFTRKTLREIAAAPLRFARLILHKTLLTLQNEEIRDTHSFYFFADAVPILRWLPGFTLLFAIAIGGAVSANWRARNVQVVAIYTVLTALTVIFLVVGSRYRMPIALGLALFGGALAAASRRRLAAAAVAALIAAACTRIERVPATHDLAEEWSITAASLLEEGAIDDAQSAAQRATDIDASNPLGWDTLGTIRAAAGKREDAAQAFQRALALNPRYGTARQHMGLLLEQGGDLTGAATEYQRALAINPRKVEAMLALARIDGALGKPAEGLALAQRAATVRRPDDQHWLLIAMLAANAAQFDVADRALDSVSDLDRANAFREAIRNARNKGAPR